MSIAKEELKNSYKGLSVNLLLDMYQKRTEYTSLAVEVMIEEIRERQLGKDDLDGYLHHKVLEKDELFKRKNFRGLLFLEKVVFYYFCLVILFFIFFVLLIADETKKNGYMLKIRQAVLYVVLSFCILIAADLISQAYDFYIWALGFFIPFIIDYRSSRIRKRVYKKIYFNLNA